MKRILVTGKNGQVGWELQRALAPMGQIFALDVEEMDLSNPDSIRNKVREIAPHIIVNPAAHTAVDKAESEPELAMAINGIAPGVFAEEAKKLDALLIHYSTDYVFDGTKAAAYVETDTPNPQSVYGKSKLAGEQAIVASGCKHVILRTSWVYGVHGANFIKTILRLAKERDELRIVADQFGAPTWARLLATSTAQVIAGFSAEKSGVYHLTPHGRTSWHGFAQEIVRLAKQYDEVLKDKPLVIHPIATHEYPVPAKRPANSSLDTAKFETAFNVTLPNWDSEVAECMRLLMEAPR
ncbi:MAG: dTDP-4-dehydrorhamnose reductase [Sideroxydans sp.]|nr:dTDP-4-dehydrorhamnose reductase [Sideroxydans sp.]